MTYRFTTLPLAVALAGPLALLAPWPTDGADAALMVFNLLAIDLSVWVFVGGGNRRGGLVVWLVLA